MSELSDRAQQILDEVNSGIRETINPRGVELVVINDEDAELFGSYDKQNQIGAQVVSLDSLQTMAQSDNL